MIRATLTLMTSLLVFFVVISLVGLLVLALALALGWVLQHLLPFTWFETTLLSMLAMLPIFFSILNKGTNRDGENTVEVTDDEDWYSEGEEEDGRVISLERFWKNKSAPTGEAVLQYLFANDIYETLVTGPPAERWTDEELQEVAADLAITAVDILKRMPPRKSPRISKAKLRMAFQQQPRWPEYEPFLNDFVSIINLTAALWQDVIYQVQKDHLWNKPAISIEF